MSGHFEKGRWVDSPPIGGGNWWRGDEPGYLTTKTNPPLHRNMFIVPTIGLTPEQQRRFEEHVYRIAVEHFKRKFGLSPPI
jgi:hypothetical protein